ncbi:hypothetical protein FH966_07195 [Lentibacillus cibarius]|uniref:Uncharacterized protein n=1 Tax=Lentibacillus cibarius TaxID=2583219 RepID=A0A549YHZ7_9BACI|nr:MULTISPECIES: hypothetical protein [Lentibacillus]QKY69325.1 hypothetical protein Len3610_06660 [Lentibacillus sp. CBA3610]TRM11497.1 hypothetical protein FH966_07195 [Lentibacillus cibarius]
MMGGYSGMMNGYGLMGFGWIGWLINIIVIGIVVYYATKLALKHHNKENQNKRIDKDNSENKQD